MTRAQLQTEYNIIGDNKDICLYRKRGEFTYGCGYCGNISLKNGKAIFNGNSYSYIDSLDDALRDWEASLPWPVDTYNPMLRKSAALLSRVSWYLTEKLGFEVCTKNWNVSYIKKIGTDYRISFELEDKKLDSDSITIVSRFSDFVFMNDYSDVDEAVAMISTIVKTEVLSMSSDMVDLLSRCPETEIPNIDTYVKSNRNIFGYEKADFKSVMISLLENELRKLKGE